MPVEIQLSRYLFWSGSTTVGTPAGPPRPGGSGSSSSAAGPSSTIGTHKNNLMNAHRLRVQRAKEVTRKHARDSLPEPSSPVSKPGGQVPHYNCLHDLESIFWMLLWFVCYHVPAPPPANSDSDLDTEPSRDVTMQLEIAHRVFTEHDNLADPPRNRQGCLMHLPTLEFVLDSTPTEFSLVGATICTIQSHLCHIFSEAEASFNSEGPFPLTTMPEKDHYDMLANLFRDTVNNLAEESMTLPIIRADVPKPKTRKSPPGPPSKGALKRQRIAETRTYVNSNPAHTGTSRRSTRRRKAIEMAARSSVNNIQAHTSSSRRARRRTAKEEERAATN